MYENFLKSVASHALGPPPTLTHFHTFSDPSQSSMTYFMNGPFDCDKRNEETGKFWNIRNQLIFYLA